MTTIAEVARAAGVSVSTVSHVVNGTRYVSPDTAKLVNDAIAKIGYIPNTLARSLKLASTSCVGLAISTLSNPYFSDIIFAVESECARLGLMVFLADTQDDPEREIAVIRALHQRRVDGIIFSPCAEPKQALDYLAERNLPCVLVDRMADPRFDQIGVDNFKAIEVLVDHVVAQGHRNIGFIAGEPGFATQIERNAAFHAALKAHGLAAAPDMVVSGNATGACATAAAHRLLSLKRPPSVIITGNNMATIGVMRAVRERGLSIPGDLSLVGIDDFEWADLFEPRLTLVEQPCREIGRQAATLLMERITTPATARRSVRLEPRLCVRESCGALA